MEKEVPKEYFQVLFNLSFGGLDTYQIDLSLVDVIRNIMHPYYSDNPLFIDGKGVMRNHINRILIVKTTYCLQDRILEGSFTSIKEYIQKHPIFSQHKDYTPFFFQNYDKSPTQGAITKLLQEEIKLKTEQAELIIKGTDDKTIKIYDDKISRIGGQVAYLAGAFLRGFLEHGH